MGDEIDVILCEDFRLRRGSAMSSDQIAPERGIGVVATFAHLWDVPLVLILPSENKTISDPNLRTLDLWGAKGHDNRHQRDASRLVVRWLVTAKHIPTLEALYPKEAK